MFGGIHLRSERLRPLIEEFRGAIPKAKIVEVDEVVMGAHAHGGRTAVREIATAGGSALVAVDGDMSLYTAFGSLTEVARSAPAAGGQLVARLQAAGIGNVAVFDARTAALSLHTEWSGSFPLYFVECGNGLLFSSLARPLARAHSTDLDPIGVTEFLRAGYTMSGRTPFKNVRKLQPGQILEYRLEGRVTIKESSRAWVGLDTSLHNPETAAVAGWEALSDAAKRARGSDGSTSLMMSAGWDSRTLLALEIASGGHDILGYSHGDVNSRELRLARNLCEEARIPTLQRSIDERVLDPDLLDSGFKASETLVFPHWHRSGQILAGQGVVRVSAGVFGEILGGHYGLTMVTAGLGKIRALVRSLSARTDSDVNLEAGLATIRNLLRVDSVQDQWYLAPEFAAELEAGNIVDAINADIEIDLERLLRRGVATAPQLLEAFVSEHRGSQYINAQLLSVRPYCDVSLPFADKAALEVTTRIPAQVKVHNRVNRAMLRRHWPKSLSYPMAATLVPAGAPLLLQETSRAGRKAAENLAWALHAFSNGILPRPRLSWVDFEFLRANEGLTRLSGRLTHPMWDANSIQKALASMSHGRPRAPTHPMYDQLGKMLTVQAWLDH